MSAAASDIASSMAPAKINLTLDVLGSRGDGFHELRSLVIGVDLRDRLRCRATTTPGPELNCNDPELCTPENLVCRAAVVLAGRFGRSPSVRFELEKTIPVGGGLGGGSSDAATALSLCNELWDGGLSPRDLARIGSEVGSDVPLFFSLPSAVMTGRGEHVEPVAMRWSGWVLLVFGGISVATSEVYRLWRPSDADHLPSGTADAILGAVSAGEMAAMLSNHLEPAVFRVSGAVARIRDELERAGVGPVRVSGAGSTFFHLFDEEEEARRAAEVVANMPIHVETAVVAAPVGRGSTVNEGI